MLAKRIIPVMLVRGRQLVKGIAFDSWRSVGIAAQSARIHSMRGVDELVILDISATAEGRGPDLGLIEELSQTCFMPLAVGGGIKSKQDVKDLLNAGADKVVIGTAAWVNPDLIDSIAGSYGSQALVMSLDVKHRRIAVKSGKEVLDTRPCHEEIASQAMAAQDRGVGEILLQCVERDGVMQGYDLDLVRTVSSAVGVPVIASGGCGTYEHMHEVLSVGADAVSAGAMFQFTDQTPRGAAEYLSKKGWEMRL